MDLEADVRRLIDEREVSKVILRYAQGLDSRRFEQVWECFAPDAVVEGSRNSGPLPEYLPPLLAGVQASSRALMALLSPEHIRNEAFGFFSISGKFASIFGPTLFGLFVKWFGEPRYGVLSVLPFIAAGLAIALAVAFTAAGDVVFGSWFGLGEQARGEARGSVGLLIISAPFLLFRANAFALLMLARRTIIITFSTLVRLLSLTVSLAILPMWLSGLRRLLASVPFVVGGLHGLLLGSSVSLIGIASGLLAFLRTMQQPKSRAEKRASRANQAPSATAVFACSMLPFHSKTRIPASSNGR